jgi:large subunit ribosomal protein L15
VATKARTPVPAAVSVPDLKAARCLSIVVCRNAALNKRFALAYIEVSLSSLNKFDDGAVVDVAAINAAGIANVPKVNDGIKILGNGELTKKLTVKASAFTASAKEKIEKAGGSVEEV